MKQTLQGQASSKRSLVDQLKVRLVFSVGLLIFCLLLTSGVGVFVSISQQQLGERKVSLHDDVNGLLQSLTNQETGLRGYIAANTTSFLDPYTDGRSQYTTYLQNLKEKTNSSDFQASAASLTRVEARVNDWTNSYVTVQIANMQAGKFAVARDERLNAQGKSLFDAVRSSIASLSQISDSDFAVLQMRTTTLDITLLVGIFLLTLFSVVLLWRTFSTFSDRQQEYLDTLQDASIAFGTGDLTARVPTISDPDFDEVGRTFNTMATTLQEQRNALKDRDILEYVSQLNALLTESLDLSSLMQPFLQRVLNLLDVQIAAFYLYDPQQQRLTLFASQGLQQDEVQQSFALGEGLVGRAAQERSTLIVNRQEQSSAAFQLKTMIGSVVPSSFYHLPLVQGKELLGVLVTASLYPMSEQTRNVLSVVASNLAATVRNTQTYEHIQKQAYELAALAREQEKSNQALRQQRDELTALNSALEEANRVRSQFLSTMSHELRTPLASIIGFSQMLLRSSAKTALNTRQANNIERILKNAQHLLSLINDVLDLAKIESGRMDVNSTTVNLSELLASVVDETRSIAVERKLTLKFEVEEGITELETDPRKVRQILLNLISNALKFTERGSVIVSAKLRPASIEEEGEHVAIEVKDSGIGIPPEKQARIFEAFYQVDNSNSRSYGGTGLGLSIVRELTTLLGGRIEIQSQPDEGSTFSLVLPVHLHEPRPTPDVRLNALYQSGSSIFTRHAGEIQQALSRVTELDGQGSDDDTYLVVAVDDNPDVLQLLTSSLEQTPYRVVGVQDASEALAVIEELKPNAITLDIMMPKVNGWQILHRLKSNPATASIPVILLTVLEDRSAGYVLGADEYLVKPVARDTLLDALHQLTSRPRVRVTEKLGDEIDLGRENVPTQGEDIEQIKPVLLVHNERNIHLLVDKLANEIGYSIQRANGDQEVMAIIEQARPDLIMVFVKLEESIAVEDQTDVVVDQAAPPRTST